ncbi:hypothetical protein ABZ027_15715 [Streptomyces sp. NPDC006332]|uniref:hypothetical protein n=1 Tax=Streptomyces sp. NPDC006332 TaxID=3155456 RepID=UPI0033B64676
MTSSSAGFVAGLTVAAVAGVGFLAYQASATVPADLGGAHPGGKSSTGVAKSAATNPADLPAASGNGKRVVYSLGKDRVWLVDEDNKVRRTFRVTPGTLDPAPDSYAVTSRSNSVTGTDGTPIEHVVRFTDVDGVTIGFSAAVGKATSAPGPGVRTGGIRESRADGNALWRFATLGERVVVIR